MVKLIDFLKTTTENVPKPFGVFHLIFCALVIGSSVLLALYAKRMKDKTVRKTLFFMWLVIFLLEGYKQIVWNFSVDGSSLKIGPYDWYMFPLQFCSSALYALPLVALLKDSKFRDALIVFSSLFMFFAGVIVYILPTDVFCGYVGINYQTMIHHGTQIVSGALIASYYREKLKLSNFIRAFITFTVFVIIAISLNEILYGISNGSINTNFFFISRRIVCPLPILGPIYQKIPYLAFLLLYFFGFSVVAFIIFVIELLFTKRFKTVFKK